MTNFYTTERFNTDYSTFGGIIYKGDYDTYHSLSDITSRIITDMRFDKQCKKNIEGKNRYKKGEN